MYKNGKIDSVWGSMLPKKIRIWENSSNKSCSALNSLKKSQWVHMSISFRNGATGLQRLPKMGK